VTVVAAFYDVHGNLPALEAVLADPDFARADAVVVGGDVASGPMPAAVLDRLARLEVPVRWVRGNADREVVDFFDRGGTDPSVHPPGDPAARSDAFTAGRITLAQRDLLAGFEEVVRLDGALYCHGSPRRDDEIITALTPAERLEPMLDGVQEALVVCGHTTTSSSCAPDTGAWSTPGAWGCPTRGRRPRSGCSSPTASRACAGPTTTSRPRWRPCASPASPTSTSSSARASSSR
jgi:predicted phosphodiesterase